MSSGPPLQPVPSIPIAEPKKAQPSGYVGFDSLLSQIEKKLLKRGFAFNILIVGRGGLGKSTLVNTLFSSHLLDSKALKKPSDPPRKTTEINNISHVLEENGVKLKVNITDTPGYGDQVNNENCWEPIVKYIKDQYAMYLRRELTPNREKRIPDTRVHVILFFIESTGSGLKALDIQVLQKLSEIANVVPLIAKSDSLTLEERLAFKKRIRQEIEFHGIKCYPLLDTDGSETVDSVVSEAEKALVQQVRDMIPFAVVGSERNIVVDGKTVKGRKTKWGIINVEDQNHCEFVPLRTFLLRTHLQDLIETTALTHYESFRTRQLLALKESTTPPARVSGDVSRDSSSRNLS